MSSALWFTEVVWRLKIVARFTVEARQHLHTVKAINGVLIAY